MLTKWDNISFYRTKYNEKNNSFFLFTEKKTITVVHALFYVVCIK